jgi:hypothetical protein
MMMKQELAIIIGWAVGQFAVLAILIYVSQKKLDNMGYFQAAKIYLTKEFGNVVIGLAGLFVMLFIFPDFFDINIKRADLYNKPALSWKEKIIWYQRTLIVVVGGLIQLILTTAFNKGAKAVQAVSDKIG